MWRLNIVILLFLLSSCGPLDSNLLASKIEIAKSADACCVIIKNIDSAIVKQLTADSLDQTAWQNIYAVYRKTADEDLQDLEKPLLGEYFFQQNKLVFKPIDPFKKGEHYLVEVYLQQPDGGLFGKLKTSNSPFNQTPIQNIIKF